jgi:hypothetical protein
MNDDLTGVSAVGVLRLMPSKAKEVALFSKQIIESVKSGDANALEVLIMLRSLELVSELVRDEIQDNILTAAEKYPEKKFEAFGAIVSREEVGVKYSYETSKDIEWERWDVVARHADQQRKDREAFLRALKEPMTAVNEETGEVYRIMPPFKRSKEGVKVWLKNGK